MIKKILLTLKAVKNIHVFIFDFLGFIKNKDVIYKTTNGTKLIARAGTTDAGEIIIIHSDSEYPKIYFPQNKKPMILDLGAHIGSFSLYIYQVLFKNNPIIYAIEPSLINFRYLKKNIKLNNFNSIKYFNLAISDKDGIGYLDISKDYDSFFIDDQDVKNQSNYQRTETSKLESFCKNQNIDIIDLMKMDIEGGEYKVFEQSINYIKDKVRLIYLELHEMDEKHNIEKFKRFIVNNNFKIEVEVMNRTLVIRNLNIL